MVAKLDPERRLICILEEISRQLLSIKIQEIKKVESLDLSLNHFHYIDVIHQMGSPTFSELAVQLGISKPTVTAFVNKLIRLNIVEKVQSKEDRRVFRIKLKARGKKISTAYEAALLNFVNHIRKKIPPARYADFVQLLEQIPG